MRAVLSDIQDGTFAGKWIAENKNGRTFFNSKRAQLAKHQMETVGAELRKNMLWGRRRRPGYRFQLIFTLQIKHPPAWSGVIRKQYRFSPGTAWLRSCRFLFHQLGPRG